MTGAAHTSAYDSIRQHRFPILFYLADMDLRAIFPLTHKAQSSVRAARARGTPLVQSCPPALDRATRDEKVGEENDAKNCTFEDSGVGSLGCLFSLRCLRQLCSRKSPKKTRAAVACGKEIKKLCTGLPVGVPQGVPVQVNNVLGCLQKSQEKLSARCAAVAMNVTRMCDRDANRLCSGVVAGAPGNIVGCLTMARNVVSPQCNAALDAAGLR
jgi:hypothetical protein